MAQSHTPKFSDADFVVTVAGRKITVAPRFATGHVLTETEAAVFDKAVLSNAIKTLESGYTRGERGKDKDEPAVRADMTAFLNNGYAPEMPRTRTVGDLRREVAREVLAQRFVKSGKPRPADASLDASVGKFLTGAYDGSKPDWGHDIDAALAAEMAKVEPKAPRTTKGDTAELALDDL